MKVKFNLQADIPNKNGTIYPKEELKKAVEKYNNDYVKEGRAFGESKQPRYPEVLLTNVAFKVNDIIEENDLYIAEIEILPVTEGKKLQEILQNPENFRIVTMTVGEVEMVEDKNAKVKNYVVKNMQIMAIGIEPKENCA